MACSRASSLVRTPPGLLALLLALLLAEGARAATVTLCGEITTPTFLRAKDDVVLSCQTFVRAPASLTIEAGATIKAVSGASPAAALVVDRGAKLFAQGRVDAPITFTSQDAPETVDASTAAESLRGLWGGLILLGKAPTADAAEPEVEGITGAKYGGDDPNDSSGVLQYVRVWYGGSVVGQDNEINGITFAGVGNGTTVENIEVAFNLDDGVEFFGGTVNVKYLSVLFCGDDGIDTDSGYQGKIQFAFVVLATDSHHGAEMDSKTDGNLDSQPRSFPRLYNALFVGHESGTPGSVSSDDLLPAMLRLREGTGGEFANVVITNTGTSTSGVLQTDCGSEARSTDMAEAKSAGAPDYLWFSKNNIIAGGATPFEFQGGACQGGSLAANPVVDSTAPSFVLMPRDASETSVFLDPRPLPSSAMWQNYDEVPNDGFFTPVDFRGAFGQDLWISQWSWLAEQGRLPDNLWGNFVTADGDSAEASITSSASWDASTPVLLVAQAFVRAGASLSIAPGTTVYAYRDDGVGTAPALVIERGATVQAAGTADAPITFTSALPKEQRKSGSWGGLILLGKAPTADAAEPEVEGLVGAKYGGDDPNDSSGTLQYVRVWYGGSVVGQDNEINGITFAGVGSGTTVDHIEVAFNLDDGVEFFGGTVNVKYLSVLFCGDDGIDTDSGYQGKIQFAFVMQGRSGHHGAEMDSKTDGNLDSQPRSFPQLYNALFVGQAGIPRDALAEPVSSDDDLPGVLRLREGTGGEFGNIIVTNIGGVGVVNNDCGSEERTQSLPASKPFPDYLYFSPNNVLFRAATPFEASCSPPGLTTASLDDPQLRLIPFQENAYGADEESTFIDPRPVAGGSAFANADPVPTDGFFDQVNYRGAFDADTIWLAGWSYLAETARLPYTTADGTVASAATNAQFLCGDITADMTVYATSPTLLTCQTFVKEGVTLTIEPGATIYAYRSQSDGKATALVIERGATIQAAGTADAPITFTSAVNPSSLPQRGLWGGLVILGNAPTAATDPEVEGLEGHSYGGDDPNDSSGVLQYVRVWYGGSVVGKDNELNGITFAGVGSGTTVDHIEVAFNLDDGVEFFGGTVNVKYLSVLFCGDDGIDTDEGYQGKIQFAFVLLDSDSHHATEMDSKTGGDVNSQPRSFPQVYNALFVASATGTPGSVSSDNLTPAMMRLREGTGGMFGNTILLNNANVGVFQDQCGSEIRTSAASAPGAEYMPDFLWFSPNNIISGGGKSFDLAPGCYGLTEVMEVDPIIAVMPRTISADTLRLVDPRAFPGGPAYDAVDVVPQDGFFQQTDYKGAFSSEPDELWLTGWSYLAENGKLVANPLPLSPILRRLLLHKKR